MGLLGQGFNFGAMTSVAGSSPASYEDFTTYTETDTSNRATVAENLITVATLDRDEVMAIKKSYGAGYFTDWVMNYEVEVTSATPTGAMMATVGISNQSSDMYQMITSSDGILLTIRNDAGTMKFTLYDSNTTNLDIYVYGVGTSTNKLYLTFSRVGSTTATCDFYSDASRTTLLDALSITCQSQAKQYLVAAMGRRDGGTGKSMNATVGNLEIVSVG